VVLMRLRGLTRELEGLLAFVTDHDGVAAGLSTFVDGSHSTPAEEDQQHRSENRFHGNLRAVMCIDGASSLS
jgi:hypothetical protein